MSTPADPFFTPEHEQLRDTIRRFIAERVLPQANVWARDGHVPSAVLRELGSLDLFGSSYGGFAVTVLVPPTWRARTW